jgi:hypothetical protein
MDIGSAPPPINTQFKHSEDSSPREARKKWDKPLKSDLIYRINSAATPQTTSHLLNDEKEHAYTNQYYSRVDCNEERVLPKTNVEEYVSYSSGGSCTPRERKSVLSSTWSGPSPRKKDKFEPSKKNPSKNKFANRISLNLSEKTLDGYDPFKIVDDNRASRIASLFKDSNLEPKSQLAPELMDISERMKSLSQANHKKQLEIQFSNLHIKIVEQCLQKISELITVDESDKSEDKWCEISTRYIDLFSNMIENADKVRNGFKVPESPTITNIGNDRITSDGTVVRRKALITVTTTSTKGASPSSESSTTPKELSRQADNIQEQLERFSDTQHFDEEGDPLVTIKRTYLSVINRSLEWFLTSFLKKRLGFFFERYAKLTNKTKAINNVQNIITWSQTTRSRYEQHLTDENYANLKQIREAIVDGLNNLEC